MIGGGYGSVGRVLLEGEGVLPSYALSNYELGEWEPTEEEDRRRLFE